jgi:transposase-like protein
MTSTMAAPAGTEEATTTTPMAPTPAAPSVGGPREGRAKRRTFTLEYKRRIVAEYDAAPSGTKGAVLRRERLYDSHVQEWRAAITAGTLDEPPKGRPRKTAEQARIVELERQVTRLEAEAARKDQVIADRDAALEVLGKGVAFLEAIASRNTR